MNGVVSLEQARMLAALGYRGAIPGAVWIIQSPAHIGPDVPCVGWLTKEPSEPSMVWPGHGTHTVACAHGLGLMLTSEIVAAPTLLEALDFCEAQGWLWGRDWRFRDYIARTGRGVVLRADSPAALLDAILCAERGVAVPEVGG